MNINKIETKKIINQLNNNKKVKDNFLKYNQRKFVPDECLFGYPIVDNGILLMMMQLGIPIGATKPIDSKGQDVFEDTELPPDEEVKQLYIPINSLRDYEYYNIRNKYTDIIVNRDYMTKQQAGNIAYCLEFCNDHKIFNVETTNEIMCELINSVPLNYEKSMKIFNKYYTEEIKDIFIYDYNVGEERFYEISGLNKENIGGININKLEIYSYLDKMKNADQINRYVSRHNHKMILDESGDGILFPLLSPEICLLMMRLGVPIGMIRPADKNGKEIKNNSRKFNNSKKQLYIPLNSEARYKKIWYRDSFVNLRVNPNYMSHIQAVNLGLCFDFCTYTKIFSKETTKKMIYDLMDVAPITYETAMDVFKKYYSKDFLDKWIIKEPNLSDNLNDDIQIKI